VIRYYLDGCGQSQAAAWKHPALLRLRGCGPWAITESGGGVVLQRGTATSWGEIRNGLDGLRYQLADPLPDLLSAVKLDDRGSIAWVDVAGHRLPIKLAAYAPVAIGLDGQPEGPCDDYGATAARLWDRLQTGDLPVADPQLVAFARLALMSKTDLTAELCHAYRLITTDTIPAIFDAANGVGKAQAGGG
jgi:hypothetical protein